MRVYCESCGLFSGHTAPLSDLRSKYELCPECEQIKAKTEFVRIAEKQCSKILTNP